MSKNNNNNNNEQSLWLDIIYYYLFYDLLVDCCIKTASKLSIKSHHREILLGRPPPKADGLLSMQLCCFDYFSPKLRVDCCVIVAVPLGKSDSSPMTDHVLMMAINWTFCTLSIIKIRTDRRPNPRSLTADWLLCIGIDDGRVTGQWEVGMASDHGHFGHKHGFPDAQFM